MINSKQYSYYGCMLHALLTYSSCSHCGKNKVRFSVCEIYIYAMRQCQIQTRKAANLHECIYVYTLYEEAALLSN